MDRQEYQALVDKAFAEHDRAQQELLSRPFGPNWGGRNLLKAGAAITRKMNRAIADLGEQYLEQER